MTLVALGVQTLFGSFFLSVLGLRKHLLLGWEQEATTTPAEEREMVGHPRQ